MNFIDPIPNAEFQFGIVCALLCIMFIFLYVGVKLINRIEELRSDMIKEDAAVYTEIGKLRYYCNNELGSLHSSVREIKEILNRPLYEVGNTIWYNRGNDGAGGVFENYKGVIVGVIPKSDAEPLYIVKSNETILNDVHVSQSQITAWAN